MIKGEVNAARETTKELKLMQLLVIGKVIIRLEHPLHGKCFLVFVLKTEIY